MGHDTRPALGLMDGESEHVAPMGDPDSTVESESRYVFLTL